MPGVRRGAPGVRRLTPGFGGLCQAVAGTYWPAAVVFLLTLLAAMLALVLLEYYTCLALLFRALTLSASSSSLKLVGNEKKAFDSVLKALRASGQAQKQVGSHETPRAHS